MSQPAATKRPPQTGVAPDDARAECPFTVRLVDPASGGGGSATNGSRNPKKRRKRDRDDDDDGTPGAGAGATDGASATPASRRVLHQAAPFAPRGGFGTHSTLDVHYAVEPTRAWSEMTRYNSFVLNGVKYFCEGFVYVANEESLQRQKAAAAGATASARARGSSGGGGAAGGAATTAPDDATVSTAAGRRDDDWVARILEIRASDEHHVYARVFWMYWPDELPAHTVHDGSSGSSGKKKKTVPGGRQPHHGASELLASNHMDVINVVSVTSMATVNHLIEDRDDDVQSALYWRQALDVRTMEVSAIETACACGMPANPDKMLVGCGNEACGKWIHEECLKHYALMRVFERLGRYKPHVVSKKTHRKLALRNGGGPTDGEDVDANGGCEDDDDDDDVKRPLSPSESGGAVSVQHSINVKPEGGQDEAAGKTPGPARRGRRSTGAAAAGSKNKKTEAPTRGRKRKLRASDMSAYEDDNNGSDDDDDADDNDVDYDDAEDDDDDDDDDYGGGGGGGGGTRSRIKTRHTPLRGSRRHREIFSPFSSADGGGGSTPTPGSARSRQQQHAKRPPPPSSSSKKDQPYHNPYPPLHAFGPGSGGSGGSGSKRKPPPPYDKLFEATLLLSPTAENGSSAAAAQTTDTVTAADTTAAAAPAPTMIEIRDLRPGVTGGARVWLEPAQCPLCGTAIR